MANQLYAAYARGRNAKELALILGEDALAEEDKNVEQQIEDYKTSLLVYKYEENYINQKLDTVISYEEIETYYNSYSINFILNNKINCSIYLQPVEGIDPKNIADWILKDNLNVKLGLQLQKILWKNRRGV